VRMALQLKLLLDLLSKSLLNLERESVRVIRKKKGSSPPFRKISVYLIHRDIEAKKQQKKAAPKKITPGFLPGFWLFLKINWNSERDDQTPAANTVWTQPLMEVRTLSKLERTMDLLKTETGVLSCTSGKLSTT